MKILVILVSYRDKGNLKECIRSFETLDLDLDVHVQDNSKNNLGFAGGVNEALRLASLAQGKLQYDWVWLLNPDCTIEVKKDEKGNKGNWGDWGDMWEMFNRDFDIWSPVVYDERGKIWFAGGKINRWTGECSHQKTVRQWNGKTVAGETVKRKNIWETEWVSGCSMFVKPKVFEKIGFFDEKFFLFYEDVDFCLRARAAGFRVGMIGKEGRGGIEGIDDLRVVHKVSQSVNKLTNKYEIEMKSKFHLLRKHWRYFWPTAYLISQARYLKHRFIRGI